MNTLLEARSDEGETVDLRHNDVGTANQPDRNCFGQRSPAPLWLEARAHAIGFRHEDIVRTHWKKIRRSMVED